jgi:hypothetical protein
MFHLEVYANVDDEEVQNEEQSTAKEKQIRHAIESLDPSVAIFEVIECELN